ncbi:MAG TPA: secondary thiamine-phosphate synthase enzyme YjbQ [Candidatus Deferrimicrobiaceae bacterium]|jgi:secondary thiamine-phosphate synthase enzyme
MRTQTLSFTTDHPQQMVDITGEIRKVLKDSGVTTGAASIFVPHTTAGVTLNENADPNVRTDLLAALDALAPVQANYLHAEGNSHAHIKATLVGSSVHIFVETGQLMLGTWQGVFLCEFDGPRTRNVLVRVTGS